MFRWTAIATVLLAVTGVIALISGVGSAAKNGENGAHRASVAYAQLKHGMSAAHVKRLLGKPHDTAAYRELGGRTVCWYYGVLSGDTRSEFCFKHWRLVSNARVA